MTFTSTTTQQSVTELNEQFAHPDVEVLNDACHAGNLRSNDKIQWQGLRAITVDPESGDRPGASVILEKLKEVGGGWTSHFRNQYFTHIGLGTLCEGDSMPQPMGYPHCRMLLWNIEELKTLADSTLALGRCMLRNDMVVNLTLSPERAVESEPAEGEPAESEPVTSPSPPHFLALPHQAAPSQLGRPRRPARRRRRAPSLGRGQPGAGDAGRSLPRITLPDDERHTYSQFPASEGRLLAMLVTGPIVDDLAALPALFEVDPVPHYSHPHAVVEFERPDLWWRSGVWAVLPTGPANDAISDWPTPPEAVVLVPAASLQQPTLHFSPHDASDANRFHDPVTHVQQIVDSFIADNPGLNTATAMHVFCCEGDVTKETDDGPVTLFGGAGINFCYGASHPLVAHRYEVNRKEGRVAHASTTIEAAPQVAKEGRVSLP